jgi:hypothetical protein
MNSISNITYDEFLIKYNIKDTEGIYLPYADIFNDIFKISIICQKN